MRTGVLWGKTESGHDNPSRLGSEERDDVQGADRAEPLVGVRVVADQIIHQAPLLPHSEEDVYTSLDWSGCCWIRS